MSADDIESDTEELPVLTASVAGRTAGLGDMFVGRAEPVVMSDVERQQSLDADDPSIIPDRFLRPRDASSPEGTVPAVLDDRRQPSQPARSAIAEGATLLVVVLVAMLVAALVMSVATR